MTDFFLLLQKVQKYNCGCLYDGKKYTAIVLPTLISEQYGFGFESFHMKDDMISFKNFIATFLIGNIY